MPARAELPFRPIVRTIRIAITVSTVLAVVARGAGETGPQFVVTFFAVLALALGTGALLYRKDIAVVVRARREG